MNNIPVKEIATLIVFIMLAYGLSQSRRVTNDIASNVHKMGSNDAQKNNVIWKALFNFYAVFAAILVISARALDFLEDQLFIAAFFGILAALGIKLTLDIKTKE